MKNIFNFKNFLLSLILFFLLFFSLGVDVFAVQQVGTESDYGYYIWYQTDTLILNANEYIIPEYKGTYDSFLMTASARTFSILFYNFEDTGYARTYRGAYGSAYNEFSFQNGNPTDCVIYTLNNNGTSVTGTYTTYDGGKILMDWTNSFRCYTNRNVYDNVNFTNLWLESSNVSIQNVTPTFTFDISLSTINNTSQPIYCFTAWNDISLSQTYECYISTNASNWTLMHYETFTDNGTTTFRFRFPIISNGTYYFKVYNKDTEESEYYSLQVTNIISQNINIGTNDYGVPQPFLEYKKGADAFTIYTQYFTRENISRYQCFYTTDTTIVDYVAWNIAPIGSIYNTLMDTTDYYFYVDFPLDIQDFTISFVFYDTYTDRYGYPATLNLDISAMNEYGSSVTNLTEASYDTFARLKAKYFQKFGFLTYPFEFMEDFFNRVLNADYNNPELVIPELKEPFNNTTIYEGTTFNFNSLLTNETFAQIHNIYLVVVDAILIISFLNLCLQFGLHELFRN